MTTIRLFGNNIKVAEKEKEKEEEEEKKSIMLFGKRIFPYAALNKNNKHQLYNRLRNTTYLPPSYIFLAIQFVQGSQPVYIGWKHVENSDVNVNLSRFLIPTECCTTLLDCMSTSEIEKIVNQDDTGLNVSVMDPKGKAHGMKFTRWKSLRRWNKLVADNYLQKGDIVHLWHFRTPYNKPCFAINIIKN